MMNGAKPRTGAKNLPRAHTFQTNIGGVSAMAMRAEPVGNAYGHGDASLRTNSTSPRPHGTEEWLVRGFGYASRRG